MNENIVLALIGGLPATIASITALVVALRGNHNIKKIEVATNSMKDALVESTRAGAKAQAESEAAEKAVGVAEVAAKAVLAARAQGVADGRAQ